MAIPSLKALEKKKAYSGPMQESMKLAFQFLEKFYLDFESRSDGRAALMNLLQLTYNAGLELGGVSVAENTVPQLSPEFVRENICELPQL